MNKTKFDPKWLIKWRKDMELTQHQMGDFIGVDQVTINKWENGKSNPRPLALKYLYMLHHSYYFKQNRKLKIAENEVLRQTINERENI